MPAEPIALGYPILKNKVYVYQKNMLIPADWAGQTILLRFSMAMGHIAVYADDVLVREHLSAFTSFDCDLSEAVTPGKETLIPEPIFRQRLSLNMLCFYPPVLQSLYT